MLKYLEIPKYRAVQCLKFRLYLWLNSYILSQGLFPNLIRVLTNLIQEQEQQILMNN